MNLDRLITVTIVYYNSNIEIFFELIDKITLSNFISTIYLVYNGGDKKVFEEIKKRTQSDNKIKLFCIKNKGLSNAYNYIINSQNLKKYHLIINPDINFESDILLKFIQIMENDRDISVIGPKLIYSNGSFQASVRLLPDPLTLIIRRLMPSHKLNKKYELNDYFIVKPISVPLISGCFMFSRSSLVKKIGGFNEQYFLYFEDYDFLNEMRKYGKIIYYPFTEIEHHYGGASRKSVKFFLIHLKSFFIYFNKWGWISKKRYKANKSFLKKIKSMEKTI